MDDSLPILTLAEIRVLGSLIEKQITTPDYYPLSLNALTNACNQLSNREPVVSFDDQTVLKAMDGLREKRLATQFHGAESRVAKYRHGIGDVILLTPAETALLCVLMLRGPQTLGELRTRSERLFAFDNLGEVETTLNGLISREPPLAARQARQPGTKEPRFAHLLGGPLQSTPVEVPAIAEPSAQPAAPPEPIVQLQQELADVRRQLDELKQQFAEFRKQFE